VEKCPPVPIMHNNISVHNPINIDSTLIYHQLAKWYQSIFDVSYTHRKLCRIRNKEAINFDRIEQLTIHSYDDAIKERREERKMKVSIFVGAMEQQLHGMPDYLQALKMILTYNNQVGHLSGNVAPVVCDWPGQLFIRKAISHLQNPENSTIASEINSFVPLLGPLHVSLNTREQVMKVYYQFFETLFHHVFGKRKVLAKKPRPWRINLL
jgi:hypothetical protein